MPPAEVQSESIEVPFHASRSLIIAFTAVLAALTAVLTVIIIPMPEPIGSFDSSTVLILAVAILFGPVIATPIISLGAFIGTAYLSVTLGYPIVFLPGIVAVRGLEAYIVARLRHKHELGAMVVGPIWETIGFLIADVYLFGPYGWVVIMTIVDILWVPIAIAVVTALRRAFHTQYLDSLFNLQESETAKKLLYPSLAIILISWGLIFLAPVIGWL